MAQNRRALRWLLWLLGVVLLISCGLTFYHKFGVTVIISSTKSDVFDPTKSGLDLELLRPTKKRNSTRHMLIHRDDHIRENMSTTSRRISIMSKDKPVTASNVNHVQTERKRFSAAILKTLTKVTKTLETNQKSAEKSRKKPYQQKVYPNDMYHGRCYNPPPNQRVTDPLTAKEIAASLAKRFEISERTLQDITEAVDLNIVSINRSEVNNIKIILGYHGYEHTPHYTWYNFTHCEYTNCIPINPHRSLQHPMAPEPVAKAASILLFNLVEMYYGTTLHKIPRRNDQYFGVTSLESTGYGFNLMPTILNGLFNMTLTYLRKSTVPEWHIFKACMDRRVNKIPSVDYALGKTKGALAYVSNCNSVQYNRLNVMRKLSEYIPVDIFGQCGLSDPCKGGDKNCSALLHKQYHFYLSFENSLCEDYITEKYWDRLSDPAYMVPIAMGGLTVQEYVEQSPENSFIHLRNFTSVEKLGAHLKYLMDSPKAYNSYHRWRESWNIYKRPIYTRFPSCDLCRIANEKPHMPADIGLSAKYNNPKHCANYNEFPSSFG